MLYTLVVVLDVSRCVCIFITSTGVFTYGNGRVFILYVYEERERDAIRRRECLSGYRSSPRGGPPIWENSIHFLPSDSYYSFFFCFLFFLDFLRLWKFHNWKHFLHPSVLGCLRNSIFLHFDIIIIMVSFNNALSTYLFMHVVVSILGYRYQTDRLAYRKAIPIVIYVQKTGVL